MALILSPLIGFGLAAGLLLITKIVIPSKALYEPPKGDAPPPLPTASVALLCWQRGVAP